MQKIKNAIRGHRHNGDRVDEYDTTAGATTYGDTVGTTGTMGTGYNETGVTGHHHHHERVEGEVVGERPVGVGVAEVPVVVTEQERVVEGHRHHHEGRIGEEVCGTKTFTEVEDRPVVRERVERIVEHRPVEKEYVVETRFVGEKEMGVAGAEIVDVKDRVVDVAAPGPTCPVGTGAMMNEVVGGMGHHQHTGMTGHHHHTGVGTGVDTGMGATDMAGTTGTMEPGYGARTGATDRIL